MLRTLLFLASTLCLCALFSNSASALDCPTIWSGEPCTSTELTGGVEVCKASGIYYPVCEGGDNADRFMAYTDGTDGFVFGEINSVKFCCTSDDFGNASTLKIIGGDGNDDIYTYYSSEPDVPWENDTVVYGGDGDDEVFLNADPDNTEHVEAGDGDDIVYGNHGADTIYGDAGNDTLDAGDGDEQEGNVVRGGRGNDDIYGSDCVSSSYEDDRLCGCECTNRDSTICDGYDDKDQIWGRDGEDWIVGGPDHDQLHGDNGQDHLFGDYELGYSGTDAAYDFIYGDGNEDTIYTGDGNWGYVSGGAGNDLIYVGGYYTTVEADGGFDVVDASNGVQVTVYGGTGDDTITGSPNSDTLSGGDGNDTISGGAGDDIITGGDEEDVLYGGDGDDTISGEADDDTLYGGAGLDDILGGSGDDCAEGGTGLNDFQYSFGGLPNPGDTWIDAECSGGGRCVGHGWTYMYTSGSCP